MLYSDKLKDPRWQKKRLEIFEIHKWACSRCGATTKPLNVHHILYLPNCEPWEYESRFLRVLCDDCHSAVHNEKKRSEDGIEHIAPRLWTKEFGTLDALLFSFSDGDVRYFLTRESRGIISFDVINSIYEPTTKYLNQARGYDKEESSVPA